ncbi:MAG: helicase-related protein, partial [Cyanobacteriota bacterium]|nr:helicase-related protein [Cyanobacteriota bacterium]
AVHNLVRQAAGTCSIEELLERFSRQLGLGDRYPRRYRLLLLESLLALVAHARRSTTKLDGTPVVVPWFNLRVQLWLRELKRMVASVEAQPQLRHSDDLAGSDSSAHLPVVHCRDCGATAWTSTVLHSGSNRLDRATNLQSFYKAFFSGAPELRYLFPQGKPAEADHCSHQLCATCLSFHPAKELADATPVAAAPVCPACQSRELLPVDIPDCAYVDEHNHPRVSRDCPCCGAPQGLLLIGSSAANLSSTWSASLFASAFNGDKKLLAFSDSVQDAAHRAGFIAARAYRTCFRTALTSTVAQAGAPLPLDQLQKRFLHDWRQRFANPVDFAATFLPHDLEWLREWETLQQQLTPSLDANGTLMRFLADRLRWEVASEFGFRARLGSSLEQAGALAAAVDPAAVSTLLPALQTRLQNEIEPLRALRLNALQQLVVGLLQHLRQRGGLVLSELVGREGRSSEYLESGGENTYPFNQIPYLPGFGRTSPRPIFLTSFRGKGRFEQLVRDSGPPTWAQHWLLRTLTPASPLDAEQQKEALNAVVDACCQAGLLLPFSGGRGERIWGIPPAAIRISPAAHPVRCEACSDRHSVPSEQLSLWDGMPCQVRHCSGSYRPDASGGLSLYRRLYQRGAVHRIVAREHTGLLERPDRERLETQFIRGEYRSDPNLLSATSTLEMGINIGDLSSVLLASVPPEPANYLQRIGRAGRRDGNAIVGTLVNGTAHDLYFFSDPRAMLQGQVTPPGCYLDAAAILRRQLLAYSLDRWVASGLDPLALPRQLKPVLDGVEQALGGTIPQEFPYTWLGWVEAHQSELLERFCALFGEDLQASSRADLRQFLLTPPAGGGDGALAAPFAAPFAEELLARLRDLVAERKRLGAEARKLRSRFNKLGERPEDGLTPEEREAKEAIRREQFAYNQLRKDLDGRPLLAMLTDEGFLPNYAFPEAGVTLKSVLWRKLPG